MLQDLFIEHLKDEFPYTFTPFQLEAATLIASFLADPRTEQAFILRGYAGTGKTSLVAAVIRVWQKMNRSIILLAPTGRAAKVFAQHAGVAASTIHKCIYRQESFKGENTSFKRSWNTKREALFIVDESSMITNNGEQRLFGSGCLLDDLIHFVYEESSCRLMFVGDTAQLPPIGEDDSPALQLRLLEAYGLHVRQFELTEVLRQKKASLILRNATHLRKQIAELDAIRWNNSSKTIQKKCIPLILCHPKKEVCIVSGEDLIEKLENSYRNWGSEDTIVITRSNKRANIYNNGIRSRIFDRDEVLCKGDRIMVVKNNYFWTAKGLLEESENQKTISFLANGDSAVVVRYSNVHQMHGFEFADAILRFTDYEDVELECRILLNTLQSESSSLTMDEAQALFEAVCADYADISDQRERMKAVRQDPYYNALQIKYAYAITCHKAQGGQWQDVYIDQGYLNDNIELLAYLRWLYTAITRTVGQLYLVNWPISQSLDLSQS